MENTIPRLIQYSMVKIGHRRRWNHYYASYKLWLYGRNKTTYVISRMLLEVWIS